MILFRHLPSKGISAERKSIYDDIERLKLFGCDILSRRSEPKGYYLASRDFEIAELKLLVDAVQSSKFITEKKSNQLIHKSNSSPAVMRLKRFKDKSLFQTELRR